MTRHLLTIGYVALNVCLLAALIGHASFEFASVEHTGVWLYPILAAIAFEGSLAYITIAGLLTRLADEPMAKGLRWAQVGLVAVSMYINLRQAQAGNGWLLDQIVMSVALPIWLAISGDVGYLVLRKSAIATPQPASDNLQLQSAIVAAAAPKRKRVAKPKPEQVTAKVAKVAEVKAHGGGKRDGNPHLSGSKEYWAWMRAWQKERANG